MDLNSFTAIHKHNEKWQDAVDVVTAKARRAGIMTYVLLAVFLLYLFGSILVLRAAGADSSAVNAAIGALAGVVCVLVVGYYAMQFFGWIKPPVWLP